MAMEIKLKNYQDNFVFNPAQYPAMVSGWATGKTMSGIFRAMIYSELIPYNLGIIFRKEYTDLRDSTLKDFQQYTGRKANSHRDVDLDNGSSIMFRHLQELNKANLQNINLGWFFIEQAEELPTDEEFFLLWGRLRRKIEPSLEFIKYKLPIRSGFITGNVKGDNWIRHLWKYNPEKDFKLIEAKTFDNADNLPIDYLENLEKLKSLKPDIYKRFVLNDWDVLVEGRIFRKVDECAIGQLEEPQLGRLYGIGTDVAKYRDFWVDVIMDLTRKKVVGFERSNKLDWAYQKQKLILKSQKWNNARITIDSTGVGDPIYEDLNRMGLKVEPYHFSSATKKLLIENLALLIDQQQITYPPIPELIDELKCFESEMTSAGNERFNAPTGKHDDCVIALALACWGLMDSPALISSENFLTGLRR
jgi:hypothetical protein